jgi:hypothetical protein
MRDNLEIEKRSRQLWLDGMREILLSRDGIEDFVIHPEGSHPEQYKGDLHYIFRGRKIYVDLKMEVKVYPRMTFFYETMSNANPGRENQGWGRRIAYDSVWYALEPAKSMVALNLPAWNEEVENALKSGELKELEQKKYTQRNLAKGVPCPLRWLLKRDYLRKKDGKRSIVRGIFMIGDNGVEQKDLKKDMPEFLNHLGSFVGKS